MIKIFFSPIASFYLSQLLGPNSVFYLKNPKISSILVFITLFYFERLTQKIEFQIYHKSLKIIVIYNYEIENFSFITSFSMKAPRQKNHAAVRVSLKRPVAIISMLEEESPVEAKIQEYEETKKIPVFDLPRCMTPAFPKDDLTFEWGHQESEEIDFIEDNLSIDFEDEFIRITEYIDVDHILIDI